MVIVNIPYSDTIEKVSNVILTLTIVTPYLFYSLAYKNPDLFKKILTQDQLVLYSSIIKAICMLFYGFECINSGLNLDCLILGIPLIIVGQFLNYLIYNKLGQVRAYYGWELSLDNSPPMSGFPLNLGHAQYKGCFLSLLGTYFCFIPNFRLTAFTTIWGFMYFYITLIESSQCGRKEKTA